MSQWTHVVGCLRVDGVPGFVPGFTVKDVEDKLGRMILWDDLMASNPGDTLVTTIPMGSEGSLHYQVIEYGTGLPWVAIPIWGDLRDYTDVDAIVSWWEGLVSKFPMIRDGVLRIEVEGKSTRILEVNGEDKDKEATDGIC